MIIRSMSFLILASISSAVFALQPAVIDLNAEPKPFSKSDYDTMLTCTLEKHPEETYRYAEYHLNRRDNQTWQENEKDPDSELMMPIIQSCHEIEMGKPFPFSLDKLVSDWGNAHNLSAPLAVQITDMKSLANCSVQNNPSFARAYIQVAKNPSPRQPKLMKMMLQSLTFPPCTADGDIEIKHSKFVKLLEKAFDAQKAGN